MFHNNTADPPATSSVSQTGAVAHTTMSPAQPTFNSFATALLIARRLANDGIDLWTSRNENHFLGNRVREFFSHIDSVRSQRLLTRGQPNGQPAKRAGDKTNYEIFHRSELSTEDVVVRLEQSLRHFTRLRQNAIVRLG